MTDAKTFPPAFTAAMLKAPDWFKGEMSDKAREMGLIPAQPSGYSDDGSNFNRLQ